MKGELTDWPEKARRLAEHFPLSFLHPQARRWFKNFCAGPVGITCSGGADSVTLLLLLWAHFPERRTEFLVLHFDHGLRGDASRADARFVEEVAAALGLKARFGKWERVEEEQVSEATARKARFAFFYQELGEKGEGRRKKEEGKREKMVLVLGHQRDDIVESQLMRLSRGSGAGGLAAPRPVHEFRDGRIHVRPLLTVAGAEIRRVLEDLEVPYRIDASNAALGFYRNRVRLEVLPLWQQHSPFDVSAGAAASRELLQEDDEALRLWLRQLMPEPLPGQPLDLRSLGGKPKALLRRALHEWLRAEDLAGRISKPAFDHLLEAAGEGQPYKMSAGPGLFLELGDDAVLRKIVRAGQPLPLFEEPWPLPLNGTLLLPGGRSLTARVLPLDPATRDRILTGQVETRNEAFVAWEEGPLSARGWRAGDRFRPLGAPGSRKLQDMFGDLKIPEAERYLLPVVCLRSNILWTPCFPPAETSRVNSLTKTVVQLTYDWGGAV